MTWKNVWDSFSGIFGTDVAGFVCNVAGEEVKSKMEMLGILDDVTQSVLADFNRYVNMHFPDITVTNSTILGKYSTFQLMEFDSSEDQTFDQALVEIISEVEISSIILEKVGEYENR